MVNLKSILRNRFRSFIQQLRRLRRGAEIKKTAPTITKDKIISDLREMGIVQGDNLFLHSSLKNIGYVEGGARTVIEAILNVISSSGTLVVPTYSQRGTMYETCQTKNYLFDPRSDTTGLGLIPATFLRLPNVQRSIHPTHSVSAIGKHAKFITESHHLAVSTFGTDSPWDRFIKLDGKLFGLGVTLASLTCFHVLEDNMLDKFPLPVRMKETYYLKCKDWESNLFEIPVTPLDPKFTPQRVDAKDRHDLREYFWKEFESAGLLNVGRVGLATCWYVKAKTFLNHITMLMKEGITIYSTPEELARRPLSKSS